MLTIEESAKDMLDDEAVVHAILNGTIIEDYPNDPRGQSCLVNGQMPDGRYLHVVLGRWRDRLIIITTYLPTLPKWVTPTQRAERK